VETGPEGPALSSHSRMVSLPLPVGSERPTRAGHVGIGAGGARQVLMMSARGQKNRRVRARAARPFYPQEQTSSACPSMSGLCSQ
jgi:hypothetical protein